MENLTQNLINDIKKEIPNDNTMISGHDILEIIQKKNEFLLEKENKKLMIAKILSRIPKDEIDNFLEEMNNIKYESSEQDFEENPELNSFYFIFHRMREKIKENIIGSHEVKITIFDYKLYLSGYNEKETYFDSLYMLNYIIGWDNLTTPLFRCVTPLLFETNIINNERFVIQFFNMYGLSPSTQFYKISKITKHNIYYVELIPVYENAKFKLFKIDKISSIKIKHKIEYLSGFYAREIKNDYFMIKL